MDMDTDMDTGEELMCTAIAGKTIILIAPKKKYGGDEF